VTNCTQRVIVEKSHPKYFAYALTLTSHASRVVTRADIQYDAPDGGAPHTYVFTSNLNPNASTAVIFAGPGVPKSKPAPGPVGCRVLSVRYNDGTSWKPGQRT